MKTFRHALQGDAITITAELALHRQTTVEEALGQARLLVRSGAGARFLQTQPCRDIDILRRYMQGMVELKMTWNYSVIVNLAALTFCAWATLSRLSTRSNLPAFKAFSALS